MLEPETKVFHCEWSKDYYEPCRQDLIALFPASVRSVLSIGCGWGKTEAEFVRKGIEVTAMPLDSVIAACAESRGVRMVYGDFESAMVQLRGRSFDGVLMSGVLHLLRNPGKALQQVGSLLNERGVLVATVPHFRRLPFLRMLLQHPRRYDGWREFQRSGVHPVSRREAKAWFRNVGLSVDRISGTIPERWKTLVASSGGLAAALFSSEYTFVARRTVNAGRASEHLPLAQQAEIDHEETLVSDRSSNR